jgi:hypothetical protein
VVILAGSPSGSSLYADATHLGEEVRRKSQPCGHQAGMSLTESVQTVSAGLGAHSGVQLHLGRDEIEVVILALPRRARYPPPPLWPCQRGEGLQDPEVFRPMAPGQRCRAADKQGQQTRKHALHVDFILHHCLLAQCIPLLLCTFQK